MERVNKIIKGDFTTYLGIDTSIKSIEIEEVNSEKVLKIKDQKGRSKYVSENGLTTDSSEAFILSSGQDVSDLTTTVNTLTGTDGANTVNYIKSAYSGSISRKIKDRLGDQLFATDLGIKGNYTQNDTNAINDAISEISLSLAGEAHTLKTRLIFPSDWKNSLGKYTTDGILVKSDVHLDFGDSRIYKRSSGGTPNTNSLIRAVPVLSTSTYYGTYKNIKITGGIFDPQTFTASAHILSLVYCEDLELDGLTVIHRPTNQSWGMCIGGRRIQARNLKVLGGTILYQDGIHIQHGQDILLTNSYVESGDDSLAFGGEPTDTYLAADPDPLRRVTVNGAIVKSAVSTGLKIYVQTAAPDNSNWEVSDIIVNGLVSNLGPTAVGGITIRDYNTRAAGLGRIHRINVQGTLNIGDSTTTTGNTYGAWIKSANEVDIAAVINQTLNASAPAGHRIALVDSCDDVKLKLNSKQIQQGGVEILASTKVNLHDSTLIGNGTQTVSHVRLTDASDFKINNNYLLNVASGVDVIQVNGGTTTSGVISGNTISHAVGASAGNAIGLTAAATTTYLNINNNDLSAAFSPYTSNISSITGYHVADNKSGAVKIKGASSISAGNTSVTVTHGAKIASISITQIRITPASTWGSSTKWWIANNTGSTFDIVVDIAPGGSGFGFNWEIDTGKKPVN